MSARRNDVADAIAAAHATAQSRLGSAVAAQAQASERLDLQRDILDLVRRRRAQAGASEAEYLDAQDDLTEAETDLALARTQVRLAEVTLLWTLGE
jgi:outer membrane protein TolC